jgi:hypothetical protein
MRFAEMVLRSLARRISSMMAEYDASTSGARRSAQGQFTSRVGETANTHPPWLWCCDAARWMYCER